jgi:hypothetical protein
MPSARKRCRNYDFEAKLGKLAKIKPAAKAR